MAYNKTEKEWLDKYEARLRARGLSEDEAIEIRNGIGDIELTDDPEMCADDELSYMANE